MVPVLEIWANDVRTEYALKLSTHDLFLMATRRSAKYTHVIYGAPLLKDGNMKDIKEQLVQFFVQRKGSV